MKSNNKPPAWFCAGLIGATLGWEESFIRSCWNYEQSGEWRQCLSITVQTVLYKVEQWPVTPAKNSKHNPCVVFLGKIN